MSARVMGRPVTVRVPAKVNVQLAVGAARPDGFHDLANVFLAVGLHDEVTATPADALRITAEGHDVDRIPLDRTNLAARAAELLAARHGIAPRRPPPHHQGHPRRGRHGGRQRGRRRRPAGLRHALVDRLLARRTPRHLRRVGQRCAVQPGRRGGAGPRPGRAADPAHRRRHLPLGLRGRRRRAVDPGRLRRVRPADGRHATYRSREAAPELLAALESGDATALAATLANDLQPAALSLRPSLTATLEAGSAAGALAALVSGSGPTTAFLTKDAEAAREVA